jgi:AraC family L-rhamnose operon regulatory protein RhaS
MGIAPPVYSERGETYAADTCAPVARAAKEGRLRQQTLVHGHYPGRRLPPHALPGVKTVGFWDAAFDQDWGLDWHRNEGIELTLLETGRLAFAVDGQRATLKPGDLTITRPWQLHRVGDPHVTAGRLHALILDVGVRRPHQAWKWPAWLVLSKPDRLELTTMLRQNEQPVWRASESLHRCFERIATTVETDRSGSNISRLALLLNELFLLLLEMWRASDIPLDASLSTSLRTVEMFLEGLHANLGLEWTVPRMAWQCGLGVTHFVHHCKRVTNMTPLQYLNHLRLEAASRLLKERPDRSVTEIALDCGFASPQYFATVFGVQFGSSPREYRQEQGVDRE